MRECYRLSRRFEEQVHRCVRDDIFHGVVPSVARDLRFSSRGNPVSTSRLRLTYLACALATIVAGLAVSRAGHALPPAFRDKLGDAFWAAMIVWWTGVAAPRAVLWQRAVVAVGVCFAVEISQLYHAPTIDALRSTTLGHLVLGNGFDVIDLAAYAAGVLAAVILERLVRRALATNGRSS
jgi:hypothetical protein